MAAEERSYDAFQILKRSDGLTSRLSGVKTFGKHIHHAIDADGHLMLLVPVSAESGPFEESRVQGVSIQLREFSSIPDEVNRFLVIRSESTRLERTFALFVDEVLDALRADASAPINSTLKCLESWKQLLAPIKRSVLGVEAQLGLIHELIVLHELVSSGVSEALSHWGGPIGERHDFAFDHCSIEVKATRRRDGLVVRVSGIEQLVAPEGRPLFLIAGQFEQTSSGAYSLPKMVDMLLDLGIDSQKFVAKLAAVGYYDEHWAQYDSFKFDIRRRLFFNVEGDFPRLRPDILSYSASPSRISGVDYSIDLSDYQSLASWLDIESSLELIEA